MLKNADLDPSVFPWAGSGALKAPLGYASFFRILSASYPGISKQSEESKDYLISCQIFF
jgi:hypothetical protein